MLRKAARWCGYSCVCATFLHSCYVMNKAVKKGEGWNFTLVTPQNPVTMDSSVDMSPEEYKATGDHHLEGAASESQEHDFIQDLVSKNRIVIFSKSQCPHCDDSKMLLKNMGVNYMAVELDKMKEGNQVQNVLGHITDARTVPRIFIDGHCVGGNSDLQSLNKSGALRDLLRDM